MIPSRAAYQVTSDTDPPRYAPGYWYTIAPTTAVASVAHSANAVRAWPWMVRGRVRIQALGIRVTTGVAGLAQFAVYRANAATLNPQGSVLANTGDVDVSVAQNVNGALAQGIVTLGPGLHWWCSNTNVAVLLQGIPAGFVSAGVHGGAATQALISATATAALFMKQGTPAPTYGTWPDANAMTWSEATSTQSILGQFQVAS
jgi:hypothetical protein